MSHQPAEAALDAETEILADEQQLALTTRLLSSASVHEPTADDTCPSLPFKDEVRTSPPQSFKSRMQSAFQQALGDSAGGVMKSQFRQVYAETRLPQMICSSLWRFMSEEWTIQAGKVRCKRHKRLSVDRFMSKWEQSLKEISSDRNRLVFKILLGSHPNAKQLSGDSFEPLLDDILDMHSELCFLRDNTIFQHRYTETVITHLFFTISRSLPGTQEDVLSGRCKGMTFKEFSSSNLPSIIENFAEMGINDERHYFSYKHFFVIYCKFYDLDKFHASRIDTERLEQYANGALTNIICERVTYGCGLPHQWRAKATGGESFLLHTFRCIDNDNAADSGVDLNNNDLDCDFEGTPASALVRTPGFLTYIEFVYFILAEEDRTSQASLEYWFRVADLDEDGTLSLYELEHLWTQVETALRLEGCTSFDFHDVVCVALDLTKVALSSTEQSFKGSFDPERVLSSSVSIRMKDLSRSRLMSSRFFDYFVNWHKLLERENTNGNSLLREIDEMQQHYFLSLQFMPSPLTPPASDQGTQSVFAPTRIPTDGKTPWARWADLEYAHYMHQEELEAERQNRLKQEQSMQYDDDEGHANERLLRRQATAQYMSDEDLAYSLDPATSGSDRKRSRKYSPVRRSSRRDVAEITPKVRGLATRAWCSLETGGAGDWEDDEVVLGELIHGAVLRASEPPSMDTHQIYDALSDGDLEDDANDISQLGDELDVAEHTGVESSLRRMYSRKRWSRTSDQDAAASLELLGSRSRRLNIRTKFLANRQPLQPVPDESLELESNFGIVDVSGQMAQVQAKWSNEHAESEDRDNDLKNSPDDYFRPTSPNKLYNVEFVSMPPQGTTAALSPRRRSASPPRSPTFRRSNSSNIAADDFAVE